MLTLRKKKKVNEKAFKQYILRLSVGFPLMVLVTTWVILET